MVQTHHIRYAMKSKLLILVLLCTLSIGALAQSVVSGQVVDAETKQPLQGASVFAQNTTRGVITNSEGRYQLALERGGYELIVSFTGYQSQTVNVDANEAKTLDIELKKEDKSIGEVVVKSSSEVPDGWEKHGQLFLKYFIGATPAADSTSLENPEALKFFYYKRNDRIKVVATEPLRIANRALGYNLRYELDSFVFYNKTSLNSYRGACLFMPMEGDTAQQQLWAEARRNAYHGSRLHFLRAYYDSTLKGEGFTVDMLTSDNKTFGRLANPYDTSLFFFDTATSNAELWFPRKASISYIKAKPETAYLQQYKLPADVPIQISYVDLADAILIMPNGYFRDQRSWVNQGYWSWKNLADQLPFDYEPEE
ncbi:carboxypeptidase-like regulatory domain-containing protein [Paracnuella aquatica]|nr:carboxypeptidase-like regulatory domain-containing protein [Paracnuella aquatica]